MAIQTIIISTIIVLVIGSNSRLMSHARAF